MASYNSLSSVGVPSLTVERNPSTALTFIVALSGHYAPDSLRLYIDHPDGVDLALCERVTHHLNYLRQDYALEVSSPGEKYRRKRATTGSEKEESSQ